jgi:hypothetical protein
LKRNDFTSAQKSFTEIISLNPTYKDVATLKETAKLEPMYQQALNYMGEKKYALAYEQLEKICRFRKPPSPLVFLLMTKMPKTGICNANWPA